MATSDIDHGPNEQARIAMKWLWNVFDSQRRQHHATSSVILEPRNTDIPLFCIAEMMDHYHEKGIINVRCAVRLCACMEMWNCYCMYRDVSGETSSASPFLKTCASRGFQHALFSPMGLLLESLVSLQKKNRAAAKESEAEYFLKQALSPSSSLCIMQWVDKNELKGGIRKGSVMDVPGGPMYYNDNDDGGDAAVDMMQMDAAAVNDNNSCKKGFRKCDVSTIKEFKEIARKRTGGSMAALREKNALQAALSSLSSSNKLSIDALEDVQTVLQLMARMTTMVTATRMPAVQKSTTNVAKTAAAAVPRARAGAIVVPKRGILLDELNHMECIIARDVSRDVAELIVPATTKKINEVQKMQEGRCMCVYPNPVQGMSDVFQDIHALPIFRICGLDMGVGPKSGRCDVVKWYIVWKVVAQRGAFVNNNARASGFLNGTHEIENSCRMDPPHQEYHLKYFHDAWVHLDLKEDETMWHMARFAKAATTVKMINSRQKRETIRVHPYAGYWGWTDNNARTVVLWNVSMPTTCEQQQGQEGGGGDRKMYLTFVQGEGMIYMEQCDVEYLVDMGKSGASSSSSLLSPSSCLFAPECCKMFHDDDDDGDIIMKK